jgi:hypothetical protein
MSLPALHSYSGGRLSSRLFFSSQALACSSLCRETMPRIMPRITQPIAAKNPAYLTLAIISKSFMIKSINTTSESMSTVLPQIDSRTRKSDRVGHPLSFISLSCHYAKNDTNYHTAQNSHDPTIIDHRTQNQKHQSYIHVSDTCCLFLDRSTKPHVQSAR